MIQTPRASFSKDGKDKRARGGVLGKRSFTLSDNFYKFLAVVVSQKTETRHVQIDPLDISTLYRHVVSYFIQNVCNRTEYLRDAAQYLRNRDFTCIRKRIRQTFECIVQGEDPERWTSRTVYKISNESKFYTRVSQSSRRKEGKEGGSFTIDKIKITAILLIASFLFFSFFRTCYERVTTLLAFLFAFLTSLK